MSKPSLKYWMNKKNKKTLEINKKVAYADKKLNKLIKQIKIEIIDSPEEKVLKSHIEWNNMDDTYKMPSNIEDRKRIFLNGIRHSYSNYLVLVKRLKSINNCTKLKFKEKVNELIEKQYKDFI